jgi:hypothetical protein
MATRDFAAANRPGDAVGKRKRDADARSDPEGSPSTRSPIDAPLVEWRRTDTTSADTLVAQYPTRALVFERLGGCLEAVKKLEGVQSLAFFVERFEELLGRRKGSEPASREEFRVFEECNRVCRMTWEDFLRANEEGRFAYCETASTGVHHPQKRWLLIKSQLGS